jgi:hypothetical protein
MDGWISFVYQIDQSLQLLRCVEIDQPFKLEPLQFTATPESESIMLIYYFQYLTYGAQNQNLSEY